DTQVKIHGHRVELGEIESALIQLPWIDNAAAACSQQTLVGYLVPDRERLPGADQRFGQAELTDPVERMTFKLTQPGLLPVSETDTVIALPQDDNDSFVYCPQWTALETTPGSRGSSSPSLKHPLTRKELGQLLSGLRCYHTDSTPLPKYGYPSAGSLYPVRVTLHLGSQAIDDLNGGHYAYHPDHQLIRLEKGAPRQETDPMSFTLELSAWLPAMSPMYGKMTPHFCQLEAGAMQAQLEACAQALGLVLSSTILCPALSPSSQSWPLVQVTLAGYRTPQNPRQHALRQRRSYRQFENRAPDRNLLDQWLSMPRSWACKNKLALHLLYCPDPNQQNWQWLHIPGKPVNTTQSDYLALWPDSTLALIITGPETAEAQLAAGHLGQQLQLTAIDHNIGLCPLGEWPTSEQDEHPVLYAFVGGRVPAEAWRTPGEQNLNLNTLVTRHLQKQLPDYMVPQVYVPLDSLPLTANGKVDRKALPEPELTSAIAYAPPTNDTEQHLCTLWQELLQVEQVGIDDNFFHLGGDSLLAIA
ncbi:hypothetical protein E1189_01660, partial [Sansalvadorimonas verongulae]